MFRLGFVLAYAVDTTPMTKIVTLLGDLENELREQATKEGEIFNEFNAWCDADVQESKTTISDAESKIADLTAFLKEQEAYRAKLNSEVNEFVAEIATNERELKEATSIRNTDHQHYLQNEEVFVTSLDEVNRALEVLSADPGSRRSVSEIQQAVRHVLQRSTLSFNRKEQSTLDSFFHQDPSFLQLSQPFQSKTNPLIELLDRVRSDTEGNRNSATKDEQKAQNAFELLQQSLQSEIETGKKALSGKKKEIGMSSERSSVRTAERTETNRMKAETVTYLSGILAQCHQKTREWKERTQLRSDELTAISEAKRILTSEAAKRIQSNNPTAFVQTRMRGTRESLRHIKDHQVPHPALALLSTSMTVSKDPFSNVRQMIEGMITRLLNAAADEADQKAWCDEEMKKTNTQKSAKEKDIVKLTNRIDEMTAALSQLSDELAQLSKDMSEMNQMTAEATDVRTRERTQAMLAIKEYKEAQSLLQNALTVLKDFYADKESLLQAPSSGDSLLQTSSSGDESGDDGGARSDKASGVIGLLEIALSDFQRLQQEGETAESTAEKEFKELMSESKVQKVVFTKNIEYKSTQKVKLEAALHRAKTDRQGYQRELAAVEEYFKKLEPSCTVKTDSFEQRSARRKQQIESLQDALKILNGEAV